MLFSTINWPVLIHLGLTPNEFALMDVIRYMADNEQGYCYASRAKLAELTGFHINTIKKIVDRLNGMGFLAKTESGKLYATPLWKRSYNAEPDTQNVPEIGTLDVSQRNIPSTTDGTPDVPINKHIKKTSLKEPLGYRDVKDFYKAELTKRIGNGSEPDIPWSTFQKIMIPLTEKYGADVIRNTLLHFFEDEFEYNNAWHIGRFKKKFNKYLSMGKMKSTGPQTWDDLEELGERAREKDRQTRMSNMR